jgi:hypothetical protein
VNEKHCGLLLLFTMLPLACQADDTPAPGPQLNLTNILRLNYASSNKLLEDTRNIGSASVESKAIVEFDPAVRAVLQLRAGTRTGQVNRADLPFAYLDVKTAAVDFRVGKQILAWGKTDALNPTDVVTPRDYTTVLPFDEDERHGSWGVRGNIYATDSILASVFYGAKFKPSTLPFAADSTQRFQFDARGAERHQLGIRIGRSSADVDFSVSAYRGASLLPQAVSVDQVGTATLTRFNYPVIRMLGFDFARNVGRFGVRIEGASVRPEQGTGPGALGMQSYRYLVAGADRTFLGDVNLNVQLFGRWSGQGPSATTGQAQQTIEILNNLIFVQTRERTCGMTARIANQWKNQTVSAELFVQHYFGDGSTYLHPMGSYALTDHVKLTAGAVWYLGREQSLFGVMTRNRAVFTELRYAF